MAGRRLKDEERRLWARVARSVSPNRPRRSAPSHPDDENHSADDFLKMLDAPPTGGENDSAPIRPRAPAVARDPGREAGRRRAAASPAPPAFGAGDPKRDRAVASRRQGIDATLDLHGMTEAFAERRFHAFIAGAATRGYRCVLVITGKGGPSSATVITRARLAAGGEDGDEAFASALAGPRGVLRDRLRAWADAPDLRPLIARLSHARRSDGGEGAYYVFLKAPPKIKRPTR